jgi:2-keto-myo-inositol isomerase
VKYCLNTSTLNKFGLDVEQQIDVAAAAGYSGIELWMEDIMKFAGSGRSLPDLGKKMKSRGLEFSNTIAFQAWCSGDDSARASALENVRREMQMIASLGGKACAAPPWGIDAGASVAEIAVYFDALVKVGRDTGVEPYLEFWGHSPALHTLDQAIEVTERCTAAPLRILVDIYHIYKGGGNPESLRRLPGSMIGIFHVNDYPDIPRSMITDEDRVFPGEGRAPWPTYRDILSKTGYSGMLSLELFLRSNFGMTALQLATKGLQTMRRTVEGA